METHKKFKMEQTALKIYIYSMGIGFTVYSLLLCLGWRTPVAEFVSMAGAFVLLTIGAWMYRLCWLTYAFIAYIFMIRTFMVLSETKVFHRYGIVDEMQLLSLLIGIFVCSLLIYRLLTRKHRHNDEEDNDHAGSE